MNNIISNVNKQQEKNERQERYQSKDFYKETDEKQPVPEKKSKPSDKIIKNSSANSSNTSSTNNFTSTKDTNTKEGGFFKNKNSNMPENLNFNQIKQESKEEDKKKENIRDFISKQKNTKKQDSVEDTIFMPGKLKYGEGLNVNDRQHSDINKGIKMTFDDYIPSGSSDVVKTFSTFTNKDEKEKNIKENPGVKRNSDNIGNVKKNKPIDNVNQNGTQFDEYGQVNYVVTKHKNPVIEQKIKKITGQNVNDNDYHQDNENNYFNDFKDILMEQNDDGVRENQFLEGFNEEDFILKDDDTELLNSLKQDVSSFNEVKLSLEKDFGKIVVREIFSLIQMYCNFEIYGYDLELIRNLIYEELQEIKPELLKNACARIPDFYAVMYMEMNSK